MDNLREVAGLPADRRMELDGRNGLWTIESWCAQFGVSGMYFYRLDPKPRQVKISHRKVRITEAPAAYAERVRKLRERAAKRKHRTAGSAAS